MMEWDSGKINRVKEMDISRDGVMQEAETAQSSAIEMEYNYQSRYAASARRE
jgi:hypothetical protein